MRRLLNTSLRPRLHITLLYGLVTQLVFWGLGRRLFKYRFYWNTDFCPVFHRMQHRLNRFQKNTVFYFFSPVYRKTASPYRTINAINWDKFNSMQCLCQIWNVCSCILDAAMTSHETLPFSASQLSWQIIEGPKQLCCLRQK